MDASRWSVVKARIRDLGSRYQQVQQENQDLGNQVEILQQHVNELIHKIESQKSHNMSSQDLSLIQTQIERKDTMIDSLTQDNERYKARILELEEMLLLKDNTLQVQKNTINELTEQNKLIKLAREMSAEKTDNHELKIKINELIRDIDRCIDLLND